MIDFGNFLSANNFLSQCLAINNSNALFGEKTASMKVYHAASFTLLKYCTQVPYFEAIIAVIRIFQIASRGRRGGGGGWWCVVLGGGIWRFYWMGIFLSDCGKLRRSNFDQWNLFQSQKQLIVNTEHWLKSKLAWPVCTKSMKFSCYWVITWKLLFSGGNELLVWGRGLNKDLVPGVGGVYWEVIFPGGGICKWLK